MVNDPIWLENTGAEPSAEEVRNARKVHLIGGGAGEPGPKGDKGDTGAPGTNGTNGAKGEKGDTGAPGTNGTNGTTPPAGTAAMLTAGTDTVNRSWSAKDIAEYVASKIV